VRRQSRFWRGRRFERGTSVGASRFFAAIYGDGDMACSFQETTKYKVLHHEIASQRSHMTTAFKYFLNSGHTISWLVFTLVFDASNMARESMRKKNMAEK
jgi:hypothetical protein